MDEAIWQILVVLLVVTVVVMAIVLVALARQVGTLMLQVAAPGPGSIEGGPTIGETVDVPGVTGPAVIAFVSPGCGPCEALRPAFPAVARNYPELTLTVAVVGAERAERERLAAEIAPYARADLDDLRRAWTLPGTPFAVGIDVDGIVRLSGVVNNLDQLEVLADSLLAAPLASELDEPESSKDEGPRDVHHAAAEFANDGRGLAPVAIPGGNRHQALMLADQDEEVDA